MRYSTALRDAVLREKLTERIRSHFVKSDLFTVAMIMGVNTSENTTAVDDLRERQISGVINTSRGNFL